MASNTIQKRSRKRKKKKKKGVKLSMFSCTCKHVFIGFFEAQTANDTHTHTCTRSNVHTGTRTRVCVHSHMMVKYRKFVLHKYRSRRNATGECIPKQISI